MMFLLLAGLAHAKDAASAAGSLDCLVLTVKSKSLETVGLSLHTQVTTTFANRCVRRVSGFIGYLHATSTTSSMSMDLRLSTPVLNVDRYETRNQLWQFRVTSTDASIWLAAAPMSSMAFTFTPSLIVFDDGTILSAPLNVAATDPDGTESGVNHAAAKAAAVLGAINAGPP